MKMWRQKIPNSGQVRLAGARASIFLPLDEARYLPLLAPDYELGSVRHKVFQRQSNLGSHQIRPSA